MLAIWHCGSANHSNKSVFSTLQCQILYHIFYSVPMTSCLSTESIGDVRITGGGDSGRLEFRISNFQWSTVCRNGFDDDAADVACRQLDYVRADDVYTFSNAYVDVCLLFIVCTALVLQKL